MPSIRRATPRDLALLVLVTLIWAGAFVGIKVAVPVVGPVGVAAARALIGLAVLAPFAVFAKGGVPREPRQIALIVVMAELNVAIPFVLISWAELTVSAGIASLVMGTGPLFAMIGAHYFNEGDRMTKRRAAGVALGFAGVALVAGRAAFDGSQAASALAIGALALASLCYVVSGLLVRKIDCAPLPLATAALFVASISLVPLAIGRVDLSGDLDARIYWALAFLGIFPTGIAYLLRFHLIATIGYATFALGINMIPIFGVLLGVILLGEPLTVKVAVALSLVVGGLALARSGDPKDART